MTIVNNLIKAIHQEQREKIEKDIPNAIIELQKEIKWLKKDNAMLKKQILRILDVIDITQKMAELRDIKVTKDAFVAMADCVRPIFENLGKQK